jgi:hypothetical protein
VKSGTVGEPCIHEWCGIIESTPGSRRQALREPTHFILASKPDLATSKSCAFVDPHRIRCVHQYIGDGGIPEQWIQAARTEEFTSKDFNEFKYCTISQEYSLFAKCRCDMRNGRLALPGNESSTNTLK